MSVSAQSRPSLGLERAGFCSKIRGCRDLQPKDLRE